MKRPKKKAAKRVRLRVHKSRMSEVVAPTINAPVREFPIATEVNGSKFETVRNVTLPELWCRIEIPVHVQMLEAMRPDVGTLASSRKRPAALAKIRDLSTHEVMDLAVVAALESLFASTYPKAGYVGRSFKITRHRRHERKNSLGYSVEEIRA